MSKEGPQPMGEDLRDLTRELLREMAQLRTRLQALEDDSLDGPSYLVASSRRSTSHRASCMWAGYILPSPNLLDFSSHEEAVEAGYRPCKTCRS